MTIGTPTLGTDTEAAGALGVNTTAVPYPATVGAGDLIVLVCSQMAVALIAVPAGFTGQVQLGGSNNTLLPSLLIATKYAAGTEGGTSLNVVHGSNVAFRGQLYAVPGVDQTTAMDVAPVSVDSSLGGQANCVLPSMTLAHSGVMLITACASNTGTQTATPGTGFTETGDHVTVSCSGEWAYKQGVAAGATGTVTVTFSGAGKQVGGMIALRPAVGSALAGATTAATATATAAAALSAHPAATTPVTAAFGADAARSANVAAATAVTAGLSAAATTAKTVGAARPVTATLVADASTAGPVVARVGSPFGPAGDLRDLYRVTLTDASRNLIGQVTSWSQIRALLTFNDVGTWAVDLPLGQYADLLVPGGGLIISRHDKPLIAGRYTFITQTRNDMAPDGTVTLSGVSDEHVIADRTLYRDAAHAAASQTTATDTRTGPAESLMYAYVNVNAGPGALAQRVTPGLSLAPDQGRGTSLTWLGTFELLSDALTRMALTDDLGWRVNRVGTGLVFEVYQPRDLSALVRFSWDMANLLSYTYGSGAPLVTREIVLGAGSGATRTIVEVSNTGAESEWGRRIERILDQSSTSDVPTLTQAGNQQLATDAPPVNLIIEPVDTATAAFGVDWALGDKVTVIVAGLEIAQIVRQVDITVTKDGEVIKPVIGIPGASIVPWFWTQARSLIRAIQDQQRRR